MTDKTHQAFGHTYHCYDCYEVAIKQAQGVHDTITGRYYCWKCQQIKMSEGNKGIEEKAMKFCKDCRHCTNANDLEFSKCAKTISPVSGEPEDYCFIERGKEFDCGPDGKNWEAQQ